MESINLKQEYEKAKKKYSKLPSYEELDKECEISFIDLKENSKHFVLKAVRRKMRDTAVFYSRVLEIALVPPNSPAPVFLVEFNSFTNEEKSELMAIYNKLMDLERYSLLIDISADEAKDAEFIISVYSKLKQLRKELLPFTKKLRLAWTSNKKEEKDKDQYFG